MIFSVAKEISIANQRVTSSNVIQQFPPGSLFQGKIAELLSDMAQSLRKLINLQPCNIESDEDFVMNMNIVRRLFELSTTRLIFIINLRNDCWT